MERTATRQTAAERLAEIAHQTAANHRMGIDLTIGDDPTVTPDWNYRLPEDQLEVHRDRLTGEIR